MNLHKISESTTCYGSGIKIYNNYYSNFIIYMFQIFFQDRVIVLRTGNNKILETSTEFPKKLS